MVPVNRYSAAYLDAFVPLRGLVDEIRLTPDATCVLQIELYGELGAILGIGQERNANRSGDAPRRFSLVAATRNHRQYTICLDV